MERFTSLWQKKDHSSVVILNLKRLTRSLKDAAESGRPHVVFGGPKVPTEATVPHYVCDIYDRGAIRFSTRHRRVAFHDKGNAGALQPRYELLLEFRILKLQGTVAHLGSG